MIKDYIKAKERLKPMEKSKDLLIAWLLVIIIVGASSCLPPH